MSKFSNLDNLRVWGGVFLGTCAVSFGCWRGLFSPLLEAQELVFKNLEALQIEKGQLEIAEQKLPEMQSQVALLKQKLVQARLQLPSRREMPDLLSSVSDQAKEAGLEVELFRPGQEVVRNFYAEVPLTFSLRGTFHQVGRFLDGVGRLSRIVTVSDISLKSENHVSGKGEVIAEQELEAICTATAYRLLDDGEVKAVNDERADVG